MNAPRIPGRIQFLAVVRKEVLQTTRDRRLVFMLVVAPLLQTIVFGYAVDFQVDRVPTALSDSDRSALSREHLRRLLADGTLREASRESSAREAEHRLETGEAAAALVLPAGLERDVLAGRPAEVQVVLDGTDPNRAQTAAAAVSRYFGEQGSLLAMERLRQAGMRPPPTVRATPRVLYNPSLRSPPFMIPGIMAMLLLIVTTVVTAMGLSREREMGTLEQVLVTPVRPIWLLTGKMAPYMATGLLDVVLVLALGSWLFDVPLRGSLPVLASGTLLYLLSTLGMGLLISTTATSQQQAFLGGLFFILPAMLLSGIMTPVRAMPAWLQAVAALNPVRYFAEVARLSLLKGAGFADLWPQLAALLAFGIAILAVASMRFRKRLG